jgi:hypothetical protein
MTVRRLAQLRRQVRNGELPDDLIAELRRVVERLVRLRLLPPSFAPYGQWDEEAAKEIFSSWCTERLVARGHLQSILDRAGTPGGLRALAERSLRHHLSSSHDRTQTHNIYRRLVAILQDGHPFIPTKPAARPQDRWYATTADAAPWTGSERQLLAHGWALGDFTVIRYRSDAAKLSPLLDTAELSRFAEGLMASTGAALTPALIMRAIAARFDLHGSDTEPLAEAERPTQDSTGILEQLVLRQSALAILAELTPRQVQVLRSTPQDTVLQIADRLRCSAGTVVNEQRRIGQLITRMSEDQDERDRLLNILADLVYSNSDD